MYLIKHQFNMRCEVKARLMLCHHNMFLHQQSEQGKQRYLSLELQMLAYGCHGNAIYLGRG